MPAPCLMKGLHPCGTTASMNASTFCAIFQEVRMPTALNIPSLSDRWDRGLPPLPEVIRYFDNFTSSYVFIDQPSSVDVWPLHFDGRTHNLHFEKFDVTIRNLAKSWCAFLLGERSPSTTFTHERNLRSFSTQEITRCLLAGPREITLHWNALRALSYRMNDYSRSEERRVGKE